MRITRREFFKYCTVAAGALGLTSTDLLKLGQVMAKEGSPPVVWIQGASCTGDSTSLLNTIHYSSIEDLLVLGDPSIDLTFHQTVMNASGVHTTDTAMLGVTDGLEPARALPSGGYVLCIEGSVVTGTPPGFSAATAGRYCEVGPMVPGVVGDETFLTAFLHYARNAAAVIAVGTCAAYGGIPKLGVTGAKGVKEVLNAEGIGTPVINVPGCPAHPDWIVGTVAAFLAGGLDGIDLDSKGRPRDFYGGFVCNGNQGNTGIGAVDKACPWRYNNDGFNNTTGARGKDGTADQAGVPIGESRGLAKYKWGSVPAIPAGGITYTNPLPLGNQNYPAGHMFEGCYGVLGCRGRTTKADCAYRKWNANTTLNPGSLGVNWCVGSRGGCQGCTDPKFPTLKRFYTFI